VKARDRKDPAGRRRWSDERIETNGLSFAPHDSSLPIAATERATMETNRYCVNNCYVSGIMQAGLNRSPDQAKAEYIPDNHCSRQRNFRNGSSCRPAWAGATSPGSMDHQRVTNVFVTQWAYSEFAKSGSGRTDRIVVEERVTEDKRVRSKKFVMCSKTINGIRRGSGTTKPVSGKWALQSDTRRNSAEGQIPKQCVRQCS